MEKNLSLTTLIFDLGGVLFTNGSKILLKKLKSQRLITNEILIDILYSEEAWLVRKGLINFNDYWASIDIKYSKMINVPTSYIKELWFKSYKLKKNLYDTILYLRNFYTIGLISGNIKERVDYLNQVYDFRRLFDFEVYTFDCKLDKKGDDIFKYAIKTHSLIPSECLYIDDSIDCISEAKKLNFMTYKYINNDKLIKLLYGLPRINCK